MWKWIDFFSPLSSVYFLFFLFFSLLTKDSNLGFILLVQIWLMVQTEKKDEHCQRIKQIFGLRSFHCIYLQKMKSWMLILLMIPIF